MLLFFIFLKSFIPYRDVTIQGLPCLNMCGIAHKGDIQVVEWRCQENLSRFNIGLGCKFNVSSTWNLEVSKQNLQPVAMNLSLRQETRH